MRVILLFLCFLISCKKDIQKPGKQHSIPKKVIVPKPDFLEIAPQESAKSIEYAVYLADSSINEPYLHAPSWYDTFPGIATFRGGPFRDMRLTGILDAMPTSFKIDWTFKTDWGKMSAGSSGKGRGWGGGAGWTGQPCLKMDIKTNDVTIYQGSLTGKVYRLNYEDGKEVDSALDIYNPIKGSVALDPEFNHILYVGQGIRYQSESGARAFDLRTGKIVSFQTAYDKYAKRRWGFFDSSPIAWGKYLLWPAENGILYKFIRTPNGFQPHSKFVYSVKGNSNLGLEASMVIYGRYGIIADNGGSIICLDLHTLTPLWYSANGDDTDATPVLAIEEGKPVLYTGCEVDKQGRQGDSHFRKLSVLDGQEIWRFSIPCHSFSIDKHILNGGMLGTPLLGSGRCSSMIFTSFVQHKPGNTGVLMAFDRATGNVRWSTELAAYSWSSPIGYLVKDGAFVILMGDVIGNLYLINGTTGEIIYKERIGSNFESSPVPWRNTAIIASRGTNIFRVSIQ
ncbi:MAG: PQQ-binding-like beta-propeller repeat protein [Candidatus Kapaibacteriota bacterium]